MFLNNSKNISNITNLDELCIYNIIYFINNNFETIVNFVNTCKEYRNNLSFYILSFNSIYINTYTNFENAIRNSYYNISDLKFINNNNSNNAIPIPFYNNISNKSIEFTIDIYNHFFRINNSNNATIYKYYDKLFHLKFNSKYNFYKTKYIIELDYFMSFFDYSILKTIKYDNNCVIDYDFKTYQYGIQNYTKKLKNYRIINSNFNLYCIFRIIKTKKYNILIQNINNIVFWTSLPYRLTDIVLGKIQMYIINDKINANDKLLRTIIILIYLKYIIAITKGKSKNNIICIMRRKPIKIYNLFNDYYKNMNYDFKPKYLNKYINKEYINYTNELYNLYKSVQII